MWKCQKCAEQISDSFDSCWNCGTQKSGAQASTDFTNAVNSEFSTSVSDNTNSAPSSISVKQVILSFLPSIFLIVTFVLPGVFGFLNYIKKHVGPDFLFSSIIIIYVACYYTCFSHKSCLWMIISPILNLMITFLFFVIAIGMAYKDAH